MKRNRIFLYLFFLLSFSLIVSFYIFFHDFEATLIHKRSLVSRNSNNVHKKPHVPVIDNDSVQHMTINNIYNIRSAISSTSLLKCWDIFSFSWEGVLEFQNPYRTPIIVSSCHAIVFNKKGRFTSSVLTLKSPSSCALKGTSVKWPFGSSSHWRLQLKRNQYDFFKVICKFSDSSEFSDNYYGDTTIEMNEFAETESSPILQKRLHIGSSQFPPGIVLFKAWSFKCVLSVVDPEPKLYGEGCS